MDASLPRRAPRRNRQPLKRLVGEMCRVACELRERLIPPAEARLSGDRLSADDFAQMLVCGLVTLLLHREHLQRAAAWLLASTPAWQEAALREIFAAAMGRNGTGEGYLTQRDVDALSAACSAVDWEGLGADDLEREHLYERFLAVHAATERRRKGVFFTPQPIVRFMLRQVDRQLREEFGRAAGIAAADVRLVDPAAGTGAFLNESVTLIHQRFCEFPDGDWNNYVVERLLPRLSGIELMPASCFLVSLHIAARLAQTGFDFSRPSPIRVEPGNALSGPGEVGRGNDGSCLVVLGNPPFSSLSDNDSPWIKELIRGDNGAAGYLEFDGERLGERKTWLHDDYVKFLRYAQWRVEEAGSGIVALVTNHGYLDNATFRILRRQLMRTFPRVSVVDLHGNRKKGEQSPDGSRDENVFGLDQGIAIGFFRTADTASEPGQVAHAELWGAAASKLDTLAEWADSGPDYPAIAPLEPDYCWNPRRADSHPEYSRGIRLPDAMPVYTTAPVTARDGLVVAFTREELLVRIERFCDLAIPDEQIRREMFPRSRTARYPAGDTRGWKLGEARRRLAEEANFESFVRRCLYRPFDWRYVFWHEAMIDWPRSEVMRHLLAWPTTADESAGGNVALIARRQMLPAQPCTYFWVTDTLTLDGVIRSDNRGSEAVFPRQLLDGSERSRSNLRADLLPSDSSSFVDYAYALFHAPGYRTRYADDLRRDFPRVMLAREPAVRSKLADLGRRLIDLHLLRDSVVAPAEGIGPAGEDACRVAAAFPCFEQDQIFARPLRAIAACSQEAWEFRVGGHQVLRKWLADRRGRELSQEDLRHYRRIVAGVERTLTVLPAIEATVEDAGGWRHAFP